LVAIVLRATVAIAGVSVIGLYIMRRLRERWVPHYQHGL